MAIHYDKKTGRFKDSSGRFVSKSHAMCSSIARREYESATKPKPKPKKPAAKQLPSPVAARPKPPARKRAAPIPVKKPVRPVVAKGAPTRKKKPAKPKPAPVRIPKPAAAKGKPKKLTRPPRDRGDYGGDHPSEREGVFKEYPEEWFPDPGSEDDFDWDDLDEDWGDFDDDDVYEVAGS